MSKMKLEPLIAAQAKKNQKAGGGSGDSGRQKSAQPNKTREVVAKAAGVSHDTIAKVKFIQEHADEPTPMLPPGVAMLAVEIPVYVGNAALGYEALHIEARFTPEAAQAISLGKAGHGRDRKLRCASRLPRCYRRSPGGRLAIVRP